jgi:hypothetical protein
MIQELLGSAPNDGRLYVCLAPGCNHSPFKRVTDLDRHYKSVHVSDEDKEKFYCDYKKCPRSPEPFSRPERLRNHLRDYHKEDLPKKGTKSTAEWLRERNVQPKWWRCYTCLIRIEIRRDGFVCPSCNQFCESGRQSLRVPMASTSDADSEESVRPDAGIGENVGSSQTPDEPCEKQVWENAATYVTDDAGDGGSE